MTEKVFIDTNVIVYLVSGSDVYAGISERLIAKGGIVSVQVLNEFVDAVRRKRLLSWERCNFILGTLAATCRIIPLSPESHVRARRIAEQSRIRIYDAQIIASALDAECNLLLTEDLTHGQMFEKQLKIQNPYLGAL